MGAKLPQALPEARDARRAPEIDLTLEGAFVAGLIAGPYAGAIVGLFVGVPPLANGEVIALPFAVGCGFAGGGLRELCPKEAIWHFSPFVITRLPVRIWNMLRTRQIDWQLILLFAPLGLEIIRQALGFRWGAHQRLFYLRPEPFWTLAVILLSGGVLGLTQITTDLWGGLLVTLVIASTGIAAAFPIGIVLALGRRSPMPIVRWVSIGFIEVIRGVPLITLLFMAIELTPIFFKLMLIKSPYDYLEENVRELIKAEHGIQVEHNYYQDREGYERDKVIHHEVIRLLREKIKMLESQTAISDQALDAWKNRKVAEAVENPESFVVEQEGSPNNN